MSDKLLANHVYLIQLFIDIIDNEIQRIRCEIDLMRELFDIDINIETTIERSIQPKEKSVEKIEQETAIVNKVKFDDKVSVKVEEAIVKPKVNTPSIFKTVMGSKSSKQKVTKNKDKTTKSSSDWSGSDYTSNNDYYTTNHDNSHSASDHCSTSNDCGASSGDCGGDSGGGGDCSCD